ncbi:polysaccharide deacetylase family protein [Jatrophihabitans telluris]|uniref:Polysaccharide deacetylase family protein n=1 Tax=Jatrophihabitans telluris TaxID=2038343 RepID=A0ABY4QXJ6_9ACTN|nr:polysaccharide deacetylase family protein [Jatrophihabitans telluris]UQX88223.1 polysaccharide deacetylase family protein [Jatrophihabitans telluris]
MSAMPGFTEHRDAIAAGRFIRVVNYHNTPDSQRESLAAELGALAARYRCVSLAELDTFYETGAWVSSEPGFIPVFYEGYRNSAEVAGPVCDALGLSAWFFVCTGFVDCPPAEQEAFARSHNIDLVREEIGRDRLAMSWDEVAALSARHTVTPHTSSHDGIADIVTDEDLLREIVRPKRRMDAVTGQNSPAMAFLWGSPFGGSARHDQAIREAGYRYLVSNTMIQRLV